MKNKNRIRVLLVSGQNIVRDGLKLILESFDFIDVCGETKNIREAIEIVPKTGPDIVLFDTNFLKNDDINGCVRMKSMFPEIKIMILSECSREYIVIAAIQSGIDAYLLKDITTDKFKEDIIKVFHGEYVLDESLAKYAINFIAQKNAKLNNNFNCLSQRETDILQMISYGKSNKEIAAIFSISEKTVRNYISTIFKKINVSNRTEAAIYWLKQENLA